MWKPKGKKKSCLIHNLFVCCFGFQNKSLRSSRTAVRHTVIEEKRKPKLFDSHCGREAKHGTWVMTVEMP